MTGTLRRVRAAGKRRLAALAERLAAAGEAAAVEARRALLAADWPGVVYGCAVALAARRLARRVEGWAVEPFDPLSLGVPAAAVRFTAEGGIRDDDRPDGGAGG